MGWGSICLSLKKIIGLMYMNGESCGGAELPRALNASVPGWREADGKRKNDFYFLSSLWNH